MDLTVTSEVGKLPYSDAHIAAYPVEYIAGIDLYNAGVTASNAGRYLEAAAAFRQAAAASGESTFRQRALRMAARMDLAHRQRPARP